ncbi:MAG: oligopeptide ABC transporter substrate-binding protein, partial [Streptococcaceae bacterium]|nr:oligopeptide ABC transporter substrate-binding protein [Streptococcaceae bacterium]
MNKKVVGLITLAAASTMMFTACGGGAKKVTGEAKKDKFPIEMKEGKAIENGTLDVAVVADTPFKGVFNPAFQDDAYDAYFYSPTGGGSIFYTDSTFKLKNGGPADYKFDQDKKTVTVTFNKNLKWSDGKSAGADDYIFSYKTIADKNYEGVRYGNITNVVGVEEYHDGKAKDISGLKKIDDKTVEVTYKEVSPSLLQSGDGGVLNWMIPKHTLESIPVEKMAGSDAVRKNPVSFGPFVISKIVKGESVEFVPNKYYYRSTPKVSKITMSTVKSSAAVEALKSNKYDIALSMTTDNYNDYKDTENYTMLGDTEFSYSYLGFKLGKYDVKKAVSVTDPNAKMADKNLRQAMGYALDWDAIGKKYYNGLRTRANTVISPVFGALSATDKEVPGYPYDLDKANKILDDAGYKKGDDGIRTNPKGEKLTINFASMAGGATSQPIADYQIQQWKKIGLDVKLATGRLIDFQAFYEKVQKDDPGIDVFAAAWSTDGNPSPTSLYGPKAAFNFSRFVSDENTKLMAEIDSVKSFDETYRKDKMIEWQKYASEEAFVIPTQFRYQVVPTNNRVTGYNISPDVSGEEVWE